jgi:opacity protein-like surface antigen
MCAPTAPARRFHFATFTGIVSILAAVFAAAPAEAQRGHVGKVELTPYAAYRFGGEIDEDDDYFRDFDETDIEESGAYGVTLDVPLNGGFSLELLVSRQESEAQIDEGLFEPSVELGDIDVTYGHVGILYEWRLGHLVPFVVGSAGGTLLEPSFPGADDETRFSLGLGGGVKVFLSEHVGLRFEGRGFWTDVDEDDDDYYEYGDGGDVLFQGEASIGLILAW